MTITLDAIGLLCPLPVLKARKRLKEMNVGERLELHTDDPAAVVDVPHFCSEASHRLVETRESDATLIFVIEKAR